MVARFSMLSIAALVGCAQTAKAPPKDPLVGVVAASIAPAVDRLRTCYAESPYAKQDVDVRIGYRISTLGRAVHVEVVTSPSAPELENCERKVIEESDQLEGTVGIDVRLRQKHSTTADSEPEIAVYRNPPPAPDPVREAKWFPPWL